MRKFDFLTRKHGKKKKDAQSKMSGVVLPRDIDCYLNLFSLVSGVSKSDIIRRLIESWYRKKANEDWDRFFIGKLATRAQNAWDLEKDMGMYDRKAEHEHFYSFLSDLEKSLENRAVEPHHIKEITNRITK